MIRYALKCDRGHGFDAWFASAEGYDRLRKAGQVSCPDCGSGVVSKALMAPGVAARDRVVGVPAKTQTPQARLKAFVEKTADYVGGDFASRARAMHEGTEEHRPIYGEAALPEARKLAEDGIPVAPLPFIPKVKCH